MNQSSEQLERLISRLLDDESTPAQRRELRAMTRSSPAAQALFEEYAALDREAGCAMRQALGRTLTLRPASGPWVRFGRLIAVAAAACLAAGVWLGAPGGKSANSRGRTERASSTGWFAPGQTGDQAAEPVGPSDYERPHVRLRNTQRDWIVIPGSRPNEYLLIEVDRVQTRVIGIKRDF